MPRYVILYHQRSSPDAEFTHWDLMLESAGVLRTWKIHQQPLPTRPLTATALADHRIDYLDYEGPISRDRGHVCQWDYGTFEGPVPTDCVPFSVRLEGRAFSGTLSLQPHLQKQEEWQVQFPQLAPAAEDFESKCE